MAAVEICKAYALNVISVETVTPSKACSYDETGESAKQRRPKHSSELVKL